ncbi:unnamed protein product [Dicrocoelium dendriticum]|nr:unnamed protein product [Dicrocoelium dendriticum]
MAFDTNDKCGEHSCGTAVTEGIQCDRCLLWYHSTCSRLDRSSIDLYTQHPQLKWICFHCVCLADTCARLLRERLDAPPQLPDVQRVADAKYLQRLSTAEKVISDQALLIDALRVKIDELRDSLNSYAQSAEIAMGRQRNVLIYNREEPVIHEAKARRDLDRRRIHDILRIAGIPLNVGIKRVHRVGSWRETGPLRQQGFARPILVEFRNPAYRHQLLNRAGLIESQYNGRYQVAPNTLSSQTKVPRVCQSEDTNNRLAGVSANLVKGAPLRDPRIASVPTRDQCPTAAEVVPSNYHTTNSVSEACTAKGASSQVSSPGGTCSRLIVYPASPAAGVRVSQQHATITPKGTVWGLHSYHSGS